MISEKKLLAFGERAITHPLICSFVLTLLFAIPFGFESVWLSLFAIPQFIYVGYLVLRHQSPEFTWKHGVALLVLFLVAFILRFEYLFNWSTPDRYIYSDMLHYVRVAEDWLIGRWTVPHAIKPLGYSLVLLGAKRFFNSYYPVYWLHFFSMVITIVAPWRASAKLVGEKKAFVVLFLLVFHVPLYSLGEFLMPDVLFAALLALSFYYCVSITVPPKNGDAVALGVLFALAFWFKANHLLFGPLLVLWFIYRWYRQTSADTKQLKPYLKAIALFSLPMVLSILAHGFFTWRMMGQFLPSSTNGGLSFVEGKCPSKINIDSEGMGWQSSLYVQLKENEKKVWARPFADQNYYYREGLKCIRANPGVLVKSFRYVYFLFYGNTSWPANTAQYKFLDRDYDMAAQLLFYPGLFVFLLWIVIAGSTPYVVSGLMIVSLFLNAWIFKAEMRYRQPFDVILVPYIVFGWDFLLARLSPNAVIHRRLIVVALGFVGMIAGFVVYRLAMEF